MDVLKDKQNIDYNYISRYSVFPVYYNTVDNKYIHGLTSHLKDSISYVEHKVVQGDTLDILAEENYGRPDYYWVIADFNKIQDPFINLFETYKTIKIPSLNGITFKR